MRQQAPTLIFDRRSDYVSDTNDLTRSHDAGNS